jgi:hypothetical protein
MMDKRKKVVRISPSQPFIILVSQFCLDELAVQAGNVGD